MRLFALQQDLLQETLLLGDAKLPLHLRDALRFNWADGSYCARGRPLPEEFKDARSVAEKTLIRIHSRGLADIDAALAKARVERIGALFVAEDARTAGDPDVRRRVLAFAAEARVPGASTHQNFARYGALIAMGPSIPALAAAAAGYGDKILRGATPAELPLQLPRCSP